MGTIVSEPANVVMSLANLAQGLLIKTVANAKLPTLLKKMLA